MDDVKKVRRKRTKIRYELLDGTEVPPVIGDCSGSFASFSEMYDNRRVYVTISQPHRYFREHWSEADRERAMNRWFHRNDAEQPIYADYTQTLVEISVGEARELRERFKRESDEYCASLKKNRPPRSKKTTPRAKLKVV